MGSKIINGKKYGKLIAIKQVCSTKFGKAQWECLCECGNIKIMRSDYLKVNVMPSCGCNKRKGNIKHGMHGNPIYRVWKGIKGRCLYEKHPNYKYYGGRGITVCKEWNDDFLLFHDWAISNAWQKGLEIDRINNDKGYSPENCRIVTKKQNLSNTRGKIETRAFKEYKGVFKKGSRYCAQIFMKYLGSFKTKEEAAEAYNVAAKEKYGEYACLNIINMETINE